MLLRNLQGGPFIGTVYNAVLSLLRVVSCAVVTLVCGFQGVRQWKEK